ncbi:MAG: response regulator [Acidobacteriota bacterium]|nr:response regulator [Acidobacteriota bacterium]
MTEQTRRNVLRYGIAIDLVILAAGIGLLLPDSPTTLAVIFAFATALSVWRGGWKGGLTAGVLSLFALAGLFSDVVQPLHLALFAVLATVAAFAVAIATRPRLFIQAAAPAIAAAAAPIAVPHEEEAEEEEEETFAQKPLARSELAEVVPMREEPAAEPAAQPLHESHNRKRKRRKEQRREEEERKRAAQARIASERAAAEEARRRAELERRRAEEERAEAQRLATEEQARIARELEERLERERAAAEEARLRAEEERQAREREAAEREAAEQRAAEALRLAEEERQRVERERAEAERLEAERLAAAEALRLAEEERQRVARELEERLEAERKAAAEALRLAEEERARVARELEERLAREREEAERLAEERRAAEEARLRAEEERARLARELEEHAAREREEAQRAAALEAERVRMQQELEQRAKERELTQQLLEEQRRVAEEARERAEADLQERLAREQRELHERLEAERQAAEEDLRRQLASEREAMRAQAEEELNAARERAGQELAVERERIEKSANERIAAAQRAAEAATSNVPPPMPAREARAASTESRSSLLGTISGWFKREQPPQRTVNLKSKRVASNTTSTGTRRPAAPSASVASAAARKPVPTATKPRLLLIERRRATADTIVPKLRQRNTDVEVVERWVDAVDEIFRFRPSAICLDIEHPEFEKIHRTLTDKTSKLPIILTGRSTSSLPPTARYAAFVPRPYDIDELTRLAQLAFGRPEDLLAEQSMPRSAPKPAAHVSAPQHVQSHAPHPPQPVHRPAPRPAPPAAPSQTQQSAVTPIPLSPVEVIVPVRTDKEATNETYEVVCFSCRAAFNAVESDWCSCLAKERSLVCTNCLSCFCKAPPAYKEKFWVEAPPRLFERKTAEARRQDGSLPHNPPKDQVVRPLVLTVEDDEEIQAIVNRVCSNLGYGFIWAGNGQDGLEIAREYKPNLILSDAFMPKLDGREMCRILKEEPIGADMRMIVMTGLYTDTKYRSEAVKRFHVDDYIAKPVAITDLINLLQKHLEGVTGLPAQEDLHELHRKEFDAESNGALDDLPPLEFNENEIPLSDILTNAPAPRRQEHRGDHYDVACFNCQLTFDATRAEWCSCVGRDNTLVCEHCHGCFCKAPAAYRERFWIDAPPSLFERKMIGSKRNLNSSSNPSPREVKRPLILLVEDDENVQLIVRTVVSSMGYGFVVGANGQEGLSLAREYHPDLILSDAFMPKLDGREMCRLLKEDPMTAGAKAIIMTGLYTDRKYRNEALDYFKVDDYVAKPLAVDDLIKLFKKHLPQEVTTTH